MYPITVRLDEFNPPKFSNAPFIPIGVTVELGTAGSSLLLQMDGTSPVRTQVQLRRSDVRADTTTQSSFQLPNCPTDDPYESATT